MKRRLEHTLMLASAAIGLSQLMPTLASAGEASAPAMTAPPAVSDLHNSVLHRLFTSGDRADLGDARYPVNLAGLESAGARFLFLSIGIPRFSMREHEPATIDDVVRFLEDFRRSQSGQEAQLVFAGDQQQLAQIRERIGFAFALEGSYLLAGDVGCIDRLHTAGVRMIGIAHWFQNEYFIDPAEPVRINQEPRRLDDRTVLSEKGRALVERMIEKKILIDVSHLRRDAFWEVVKLNADRTPLVASHSNARAVCDVPRNLDNAQIKAIAKSGGLIGVCLHQPLLSDGDNEARVVDVCQHIDHIKKIAGTAHVAIGTDFEGRIKTPQGLGRFEDLPKIGAQLKKRGYAAAELDAILWKNVLRILPGEAKTGRDED